MRETLSDASGVGLAAPQTGEPLPLPLAIIEDKAEYQANLSETVICQAFQALLKLSAAQ